MISFRGNRLENMVYNAKLVSLLGQVREFKGKQDLYARQAPEILDALRQRSLIQSAESSNRIEGIVVDSKRLPIIVHEKGEPRDRSEAELAGYRDVLELIHTSGHDIPLSTSVILQLHRTLLQYTGQQSGKWKNVDNVIKETLPSGEERIRFIPIPAWQTDDAMRELVALFNAELDKGIVDPMVLIVTFTFDFLSIHPFTDGNGRMARLLTLLLLHHADFEVGRFISLEKVIEETKDRYYETLSASSLYWHEGKHDLAPWIEYFLVVMLIAYRRYADRVGEIVINRRRGWKEEKVINTVRNMAATFSISDIEERCPSVSRPTITRVLQKLSQAGEIKCIERGRNAKWGRIFR